MKGESKKRRKSREISRSRERNLKDVGCKDKGDTRSGGGIRNNTTKVKRKSEDHRCGHIHCTDSEICIVGVGKDP